MTRFFKRDAWLPWLAVSVLFLAGSWTSERRGVLATLEALESPER